MKQKSYPHRIETHRALELLSDYYTKLAKTQEKHLIIELERLIRVLKSRFFQALIDIQEFYEIILLDGYKINNLYSLSSQTSLNAWNANKEPLNQSFPKIDVHHEDSSNFWTNLEISIFRSETGLGFSIAGGTDNPHVQNDSSIYVTKIIPGGSAALDGRLQVHDIIEKVNGLDLTHVTHAVAVNTLKQTGSEVKLVIRRKRNLKNVNEIELSKVSESFGFSIAGGIGNQHIPGENGIYITKIMDGGAAQLDGRLKVGQQLTAIKNSTGYRDLENVTHEEAVEALKSTQDKITLYTVDPVEQKQKFLSNSKNIQSTYGSDSKEILYRVELPYIDELTLVYLERNSQRNGHQYHHNKEISDKTIKKDFNDYTRPIIILGPTKHQLSDDLINEFPDKFGRCIPHTTRSERNGEIDGKDYHFVKSRDEMENYIRNRIFIEVGQYNGNLYGTSISAIKEIAQSGKHCILDVTEKAIKRLYTVDIYPIILFIKVESPNAIMNLDANITEEQAKRLYYQTIKIEEEFAEYFTGVIKGDNYQQIYEMVKKKIALESDCQI